MKVMSRLFPGALPAPLLVAVAIVGLLSLMPACVQRDGASLAARRQASGSGCGPLGYLGCCDGDTLRYCDAGGDGGASAVSTVCAQGCGWNAVFGLYACGGTLPQDPGGLPRACPQLDAGLGDSGGGADVGSGDGASDAAAGDGIKADASANGCGGIDYFGCCAGSLLRYCVGTAVLVLDCGAANACGWEAGQGFYACGGQGADPSEQHARDCPTGSPDASVPKDLGAGDSVSLETGIAPDSSNDGATVDQAAPDGLLGDGQRDTSTDLQPDKAAGLEVSGFDSVRSDVRTTTNFGGGGCSCHVAAHAPSAGWLYCLLAWLFVRRRRGRRR